MFKTREKYDYYQLKEEREYGFYWYHFLWRIFRPILIAAIAIIICIGIISTGLNIINKKFIAPVDVKDKKEILFVVENGTSLSKVSKLLQNQGIIRNRHFFKYYCDFIGLGQKIQAGEYLLKKSMTVGQIAETLSNGDGKSLTANFTIIPGQNIEDIANYLYNERLITNKDEFLKACQSGEEFRNYYFIDELFNNSLVSNKKYVLEGYLAANTYEIYRNSSVKAIINKLLGQTNAIFTESYDNRAKELNLNMDQVLSLASMIEKEAKKNDFAKVSAVFHNRLKKNMPLQSDVSIHYISNVRRMLLNKHDLDIDSAYNTYKNKGLPPSAICSPSPEAIYAALYPDESFIKEKYLYFCSKNPESGELYFSKTLKEHEKAVELYAPLWKAYDEKRGLNNDK